MMLAHWCHGAAGNGRVDIADRGFQLGDGVFDTLVAFNGVPIEGERHLQRLSAHAAAIGIAADRERITEGWRAVLAEAGREAVILRTTVTRGVAARGLWPEEVAEPTVVVQAHAWRPQLVEATVRLATASVRRNEKSPTARVKSLAYLDNVLAAREAKKAGADDALLLNTAGAVACTTVANVFALSAGRLSTPPVADGVMAGIMRACVIEAARRIGLDVHEATLLPADVVGSEALFVTNSVRFLLPVCVLDRRAFAMPPEPIAALRHEIAMQVAAASGYRLPWLR